MNKILLSIIIIAAMVINADAQNVNIPDANFKAYLVGNTAINTNGDTEIQFSEATAFTGAINCSNLSIADLTGIEAFTGLTQLYCADNQLTAIDISSCTNLLDFRCQENQLTALDITNNINLTSLYCYDNNLTSLDVSANVDLTELYCSVNQITSLDVSTNINLTLLYCTNNQLTSLDLSTNASLTHFRCIGNQLTSLNVANGNNNNVIDFVTIGNPNLTCIQVDDVVYSTANWANVDATSSFSLNCFFPVSTSKLEKTTTKIYPNPVQDQLFFELENEVIKAITIVDFSGKVVQSISNPTTKSINVSNLPKGIYVLNISTKNGMSTNRFVKQ